jgi:hypothetical protein
MRGEKILHKVRIVQSGGGTVTWAVTIPISLSHWRNVFVSIKEEGDKLVLLSGAQPGIFNNREVRMHSDVLEKIKL